MAKGVKKIVYIKGTIDHQKNDGSIIALPNEPIILGISEWDKDTTEADKKNDITWILQTSDRKFISKIKIPAKSNYKLTIPKRNCGFTYYVEASLSGKSDIRKTGLYVIGKCPPRINHTKWSKSKDGLTGVFLLTSDNVFYLIADTEGINDNIVSVEVFSDKLTNAVATYTNIKIIDGKLVLEIKNANIWFKNLSFLTLASFNVKIKNASGKYIDMGKEAITPNYLSLMKSLLPVFEVPKNKTATKVGETKKDYSKVIPCKYEKITIRDKDSNKEPFDITVYEEKTTKLTKVYETVASSDEGKSKVEIVFENLYNKQCFAKPLHKKEVEIYVNNVKQKTEVISAGKYILPIEAEANKILLRTHPEIFFLTPDTITQYKLVTKTCAKPNNPIIINVYPNVEREVAFVLSLLKTYNKENNTKITHQESLTEYGNDYALKLIKNVKETLIQTKGGFGLALQAKVKVDNVESSIELAKTRSQIKALIDFYYKVEECISIFDGGKAEGTPDKYIRKPGIKWTFDIEPPNVAFALRINNKKIRNTNEVVTQFIGGFVFKPIIKFKFSVDILSLLQYFGLGGKIADYLKEEIEKKYEFTLYLMVETSLEAKGEFTLNYNKIEGFAKGKRKLEVEAAIAVKGGAKAVGDKNMVIVYVPEADGKLQKVKVEKWKAEATATAMFLYTIEGNADSKGQYRQHKLEFSGIKATLIFYSIRQGMQYNESFKKEFTIVPKPDEPWFKSDKEYII
jgi:hypothetical protein